ncbi:MAG TPA: alpha-ketoglutarate-dependent dioxygenase AlkB [Acidimicrobiia bacterium]|nr:alpha-ketoglutarate-dependent dioxygenase AlkB [Acidimicrobiia bacterium]
MTIDQRSLLATGEPALDPGVTFERIQLDEASWVDLARGFLHGADVVLDHLVATVGWSQGRRFMYERYVDDPRLSHWYRDGEPMPHPVLEDARLALSRRYRKPLSGAGLNYYRNGRDSVASHRDREMRYLDDTIVAILTLGACRPFLIGPHPAGPSRDLRPASGDLLVMGGRFQAAWRHGVPKVARPVGPRISVTWRWSSGRGRADRGVSFRSPRRFDRS